MTAASTSTTPTVEQPPQALRTQSMLEEPPSPSPSLLLASPSRPSSIFRSLSLAAHRTFHKSVPIMYEQSSPTNIQHAPTSPIRADEIAAAQACAEPPGPESSLTISATANLPVEIGAYTAAGWHLVADESGSGRPLSVRKANQDSFGVQAPVAGNGIYFAVFDGHGANGREASQLVRNYVPPAISTFLNVAVERSPRVSPHDRRRHFVRAFTRAFCDAERQLRNDANRANHSFSGTTATCCWLDGADLFCAWVGDSRAVLGRRELCVERVGEEGDGNVPRSFSGKASEKEMYGTIAVDLSSDHKPDRRDEKRRVRGAGGRVTRWHSGVGPQRVWLPNEWVPGLAMTRSIGDTILTKYGVVASPEVTMTRLGADEEFIVVASDGVWEFMSSAEVVELVSREKKNGAKSMDAAKTLVDEAVLRWKDREQVVDDATAVVIYLNMATERTECVFKDGGEEPAVKRNVSFFRRGTSVQRVDMRDGEPWLVGGTGRLAAFYTNSNEVESPNINNDMTDINAQAPVVRRV